MFFNPGDIQVNSVFLTSTRGSVDLTNLYQMISIYESVLMPGVNAEIVVLEDKNLAGVLPLIGEETVTISFNTPSLDGPTYTFSIASLQDAQPTSNQKTKAYRLDCVSTEVNTHQSTLIQKSYNTNVSNMVQDIVKSFLKSSKHINTEQTMGIQQYIVSNKQPFDAILDLVKRAASSTNKSSTFVFFENQDGFNFKTIEGMLQQAPVSTYTNNTITADSIYRVIFKNLIGYTIPEQFNTPGKIGQGAFASITKTFDFKTMQFVNNLTQPANMNYAGSATNSAGFIAKFAQAAGRSMHLPVDSIQPDNFISSFIGNQKAFVANLDQLKMVIRIFGDSTLKAGDMINVNIMQTDGSSGQSYLDPMLSGKWMISDLRHVILPMDAKPQYTCICELTSGGYGASNATSGTPNV
ncbi:MAG: hypothetical protein P4L79_10330 [Legionella sp.]|uniref:hypothetical protein n=1 Tax=Legionella sp. TaxID=459 RepID=UPI0028456A98|nr:hypothetical protein [Legionella sp.]